MLLLKFFLILHSFLVVNGICFIVFETSNRAGANTLNLDSDVRLVSTGCVSTYRQIFVQAAI
jgi:hypothetical protein